MRLAVYFSPIGERAKPVWGFLLTLTSRLLATLTAISAGSVPPLALEQVAIMPLAQLLALHSLRQALTVNPCHFA
ncbi:MAG: hypothetical protein RLZZ490_1837 [Cyanobacteriota bacterium]